MLINRNDRALDISNLNASYGEKKVLEDINFTVDVGHTYGLIGLNGVGKTTLIKIILGLKSADTGCVKVLGNNIIDSAAVRHDISYLPERFDPPWFLKGIEFIYFVASLYKRGISDNDIEEYCDLIALDPKVLKNKVQTYSKGMRQKLGLIATVLSGCKILILDEPMSGLDPLARALVKKLLNKLKSEECTVILSSHILADMDEICDVVTIIDSQKIRFTGTPSLLKEKSNQIYLEKAFLTMIGKPA